jgi:hypothetical protein
MSYGFGYGSLWSLVGLVHAPSGGCLLCGLIFVAGSATGRRGGCHHSLSGMRVVFAIKCSTLVYLYIKHIYMKCRTWVWGGPRSPPLSFKLSLELGAPRFGLRLRPSGEYTGQFFPARWQWRQSQLSQLPKKERSSMLPVLSIVVTVKLQLLNRLFLKQECFHAVHPGGDEPRWQPLIAHLAVTKWRSASKMSWQTTVATAANSCSRAMAALVLRLWRLPWWRPRRVHGDLCMELDSIFCMIFVFIFVFGHFSTNSVQLIQLIIFGLFHIIWPCIFGPKKSFLYSAFKKN